MQSNVIWVDFRRRGSLASRPPGKRRLGPLWWFSTCLALFGLVVSFVRLFTLTGRWLV